MKATSRVRSLERGLDRGRLELAGLGVEVDPAHGRPDRLRRPHPRAHVGVVVEAGDDDLVPRAPVLASVRARSMVSWVIERPNTTPAVGGQQVADGCRGRPRRQPRRCARPASCRHGWPAAR